ncbi:MAG: GNAT family N-acetyltransferase [Bdellovibrionales bacterium]
MKLIRIPRTGPIEQNLEASDVVVEVVESTRNLYERSGYLEPWIGYLAFEGAHYVGTCAFKSRPHKGRVEIAYFTFPEFQGRGYGTQMAKALVEIAHGENPKIVVIAQTTPEESPSNSVLKKIGFKFVEVVDHPEDGEIWEWHLDPSRKSELI